MWVLYSHLSKAHLRARLKKQSSRSVLATLPAPSLTLIRAAVSRRFESHHPLRGRTTRPFFRMRLLRHPAFLAVALSHFSVDILNGQLGVLLAALSTPLHINNATLGLIATTYQIVGALAQPIFGWASDGFGSRWTTAGGVLWMALFYSLFALAPGYWPIVFLIVGSLGSAAFHPPG